jgi:chromatin remodeling complex protein RSC6
MDTSIVLQPANPQTAGKKRSSKKANQELEKLATSVGSLVIESEEPVETNSFQLLENHILKCSRQIQSLSAEMTKLKKALHQLKQEHLSFPEVKDSSNEDTLLDLSNELVAFLGGNMKTSDEVKQALQKYVMEHNLAPDSVTDANPCFKPDTELKKLLGVKRLTKQFSVDDVHREVLKLHIKKPDMPLPPL